MNTLTKKRGICKSKLTLFTKFVGSLRAKEDEITDVDILQLRERVRAIEECRVEFENLQAEIEENIDNESDLEKELNERESFENIYFLQISLAQKLVNDNDPSQGSQGPPSVISGHSSNQVHAISSQLGEPVEHWSTLLIFLVISKLDNATVRKWEDHKSDKRNLTFADLKQFLKARADVLEAVMQNDHPRRIPGSRENIRSITRGFAATGESQGIKCLVCGGKHSTTSCDQLTKLNVNERMSRVKELRLCMNCLKKGHYSRFCRQKTCSKCRGKHHVLLHGFSEKESSSSSSSAVRESVGLAACSDISCVFLSTVQVRVLDKDGNPHTARALLDNGSQSSFITRDLCERLRLPREKVCYAVKGLNQRNSCIDHKCKIKLQALHGSYETDLHCFILDTITGSLPQFRVDPSALNIPKRFELADPSYFEPGAVSILIGADLYYEVLRVGMISLGHKGPVIHKTCFGWVVCGPMSRPASEIACHFSQNLNCGTSLQKFWEIEEISTKPAWSNEEQACEDHFVKTTERNIANENAELHPEICEIIKSDFYVDDLLTGADSIVEATNICKGVRDILNQGCFELRKFYSNDDEVLKSVVNDACDDKTVIHFGENENAKTLGIIWCPKSDVLQYKINQDQHNHKVTKRSMLSGIAQIFDPIGLLSPCIIQMKILMQRLWLEKLTWDELVPAHISAHWNKFLTDLTVLNDLHIHRRVLCDSAERIEMHGFSDASEAAYGGCIYLRSTNAKGETFVSLLCAKTKVAPLKTVSLPRLELLGALVLARLAKKVRESLRLRIDKSVFWSDSTIVLSWLKTPPNKLKSFVSNRVSEIQQLTASDCWRHVSSGDNPADLLSRGVGPKEIAGSDIWWHAPRWLRESESCWPCKNVCVANVPDMRKEVTAFVSVYDDDILNRFSSLNKLQRVTAWMIRFAENCKTKRMNALRVSNHLSVGEIKDAAFRLTKISQHLWYKSELGRLREGKPLKYNSKVLNLKPFIDDCGILRVGGRLEQAKFAFEKKHPIILSDECALSRLIVEDAHKKLFHAGPRHVLAVIREEYWIIGGRRLCNKVISKCIVCYRYRAKALTPIMASFPEQRLNPRLPFQVTGVDYAGPFMIKDRSGRGCRLSKAYACLFICFTVKAVHLELVTDLSKDAFISALRRFVARRGKPSQIFSDNGTNFVASNSELRELGGFICKNKDELEKSVHNEGIDWRFIPPQSPHFGGLWEAGVKSIKHHLRRVLKDNHFTFEQFYTILVQVEAILNSRPISLLSESVEDLNPLTPSHFLVGRPLMAVPDADVSTVPVNRLSLYQHIQQLVQHIWSRWSKEYVSERQVRTKWKVNQHSLQKGVLVLIKDDQQPPLRWKLGRVEEIHLGKDGIVRVATLRTHEGLIRRSCSRICPLPVEGAPLQE
nr:unnamed protein product [Callosobruchus chinensis]